MDVKSPVFFFSGLGNLQPYRSQKSRIECRSLGVEVPSLFFDRELCRKANILGANWKGGAVPTERRKIAENRMLTDVNRRYFGICGRFSAANQRLMQEVAG